MIVFCNIQRFNTGIVKIDELSKFLSATIKNKYVKDESGVELVQKMLSDKVKELNRKYPHSKNMSFETTCGPQSRVRFFKFVREGSNCRAFITVTLLEVEEFKEGGAL